MRKELDVRVPVVVRDIVAALCIVSKHRPHHRAEVRPALLDRAHVGRERDASSGGGPVEFACESYSSAS